MSNLAWVFSKPDEHTVDKLRLASERYPTLWPLVKPTTEGAYASFPAGFAADVVQAIEGWRRGDRAHGYADVGTMTQLYGAAVSIGNIAAEAERAVSWERRWHYLAVAKAFGELVTAIILGRNYQREASSAAGAIYYAAIPNMPGNPAAYLKLTAEMFMRKSSRIISEPSLKRYSPSELSRSRLARHDETIVSSAAGLLQSLPPTTLAMELEDRLILFSSSVRLATSSFDCTISKLAWQHLSVVTWRYAMPISTLMGAGSLPLCHPVFYHCNRLTNEHIRLLNSHGGLMAMTKQMVDNYDQN